MRRGDRMRHRDRGESVVVSDARLMLHTLALRRALASDEYELSPVVAPAIAAYGSEGQTAAELQLALSELPD